MQAARTQLGWRSAGRRSYQGAKTPGVDGITAAWVDEQVGVPGFLDDLRAALKDGWFRPLPVRERKIPRSDSVWSREAPLNRARQAATATRS